jgi:hypothetical protein
MRPNAQTSAINQPKVLRYMSYTSKYVTAVVGLLVMAIVFSRQLFLYTGFRDPQGLLDPSGGRYHLWLSLAAAVMASIAGALMVYFFSRRSTNELSQAPSALRGEVQPVASESATSNAPAASHSGEWVRVNPWLPEGQSNDRIPADGSVSDSRGTPAGRRTLARESHQLKFKRWSQARSD